MNNHFKDFKQQKKIKIFNKKNSRVSEKNFIMKKLSYKNLLNRVFVLLSKNKNKTSLSEKIKIPPPRIKRDGPKKTVFTNFFEICKKINRNMDHLVTYITGELGTSASIQNGGGLVLKGRFLSKGIESILRSYIRDYVLCQSCKSARTKLHKDLHSKLFFIYCHQCYASRSVNNISKTYFAKIRRKK